MSWEFITSPMIHISIIWVALVAICIRTIQHGMSLKSEISRYEEYRAEVYKLMQTFDNTESTAVKIEQMKLMELESARELRSFLREHQESSFII